MTIPTLLQTQYLKRHITMQPMPIPVCGPFMSVSVDTSWFNIDGEACLTITDAGVRAFWCGVSKHGVKAVCGKPAWSGGNTNIPPTGGSPVAVAA